MTDRPSCSWCSTRAVAQLRARLRWVSALIPPRLVPSCATHLIEKGIAFRLDTGWPVRVDVVPYVADERDVARVSSGIIAHHRHPELT